MLLATGFSVKTTSSQSTTQALPSPIQETFCPAVFAELMASVQNRSSKDALYKIAKAGNAAFSDASPKIKRTKTNNQKIDSLLREVKTTNDPSRIKNLPVYVKNITEATNASAILADETLQIFLTANQIIQESLGDLKENQTSKLTKESSEKLMNQWQNLIWFFGGFSDLASSANSKWQNTRDKVEVVFKEPSRLNNETRNEIDELFQDAENHWINMKNVTDMFTDISIKNKFADLPDLFYQNQTYIEKERDRLWKECQQSSNSTMALMTYLQRALSNVDTTISIETTTTDDF